MSHNPLSPAEDEIMRYTFEQTMMRAADLVDAITPADVLEAQAQYLSEGMTLEQVSRIDRAMLAAAHLRACAEHKANR